MANRPSATMNDSPPDHERLPMKHLLINVADPDDDALELEPGENWCRLIRSSILDPTQSTQPLYHPQVLARAAMDDFSVFPWCFDVDGPHLAIKDTREAVKDGLKVGIVRSGSTALLASAMEALPLHQLRLLHHGDRLVIKRDSVTILTLECRWEALVELPTQSQSSTQLTQTQQWTQSQAAVGATQAGQSTSSETYDNMMMPLTQAVLTQPRASQAPEPSQETMEDDSQADDETVDPESYGPNSSRTRSTDDGKPAAKPPPASVLVAPLPPLPNATAASPPVATTLPASTKTPLVTNKTRLDLQSPAQSEILLSPTSLASQEPLVELMDDEVDSDADAEAQTETVVDKPDEDQDAVEDATEPQETTMSALDNEAAKEVAADELHDDDGMEAVDSTLGDEEPLTVTRINGGVDLVSKSKEASEPVIDANDESKAKDVGNAEASDNLTSVDEAEAVADKGASGADAAFAELENEKDEADETTMDQDPAVELSQGSKVDRADKGSSGADAAPTGLENETDETDEMTIDKDRVVGVAQGAKVDQADKDTIETSDIGDQGMDVTTANEDISKDILEGKSAEGSEVLADSPKSATVNLPGKENLESQASAEEKADDVKASGKEPDAPDVAMDDAQGAQSVETPTVSRRKTTKRTRGQPKEIAEADDDKAAGKEPDAPNVAVEDAQDEQTVETPTVSRRKTTKRTRGQPKEIAMEADKSLEAPAASEQKPTRKRARRVDEETAQDSPSSDSPSTRRSSRKRAKSSTVPDSIRVLVTKVDLTPEEQEMVKEIGGTLLDKVEEAHMATHVIASDGKSSIRRTPKLMIAINKTANIVTKQWLVKSAQAGRALPCDKFLVLTDKEAENRYHFSMEETLQRVEASLKKGTPLLAGRAVYAIPGVCGKKKVPPANEMRLIVEAAGGQWIGNAKDLSAFDDPSQLLVVTSGDGESRKVSKPVAALIDKGAREIEASWLFDAVMSQKLN